MKSHVHYNMCDQMAHRASKTTNIYILYLYQVSNKKEAFFFFFLDRVVDVTVTDLYNIHNCFVHL